MSCGEPADVVIDRTRPRSKRTRWSSTSSTATRSTCVIDGREERVRLTGIDTPEVAQGACGTGPPVGECFGDEATAFTESLLPVGTPVRLERDIVGRDDYGRMLAYVYRANDGIFVNYEIVRQGYAQPLTIPPNVTFADAHGRGRPRRRGRRRRVSGRHAAD